MPKGKVGDSGQSVSDYRSLEADSGPENMGRDRKMRSVKPSFGQRFMTRFASSLGGRLLGMRSVVSEKPVITPYHRQIGQDQEGIEPSLNGRPFNDFWKLKEDGGKFTDTVDHQIMEVRRLKGERVSVDGLWHLKSPGRESSGERRKRKFQKIIYRVLGQNYKGLYYDDHKLLVQKEVLATSLYHAVILEDNKPDEPFAEEFQCGYSFDETQNRHCVAVKHLNDYENGSTLFDRNIEGPQWRIFDETHNPATNLVIRRFFLGDEDYLKLDNYMIKQDQNQMARTRMYCIDFGMAFYNMFRLPRRCSIRQFKKKLLAKSKKHRAQYHGKPNIHTVLRLMDQGQVERGILNGLEKVARLEDEMLDMQLRHIHDPVARISLFTLLKHRRDQARAMLWPKVFLWPEDLPEEVSAGLVRQDLRS